MSPGASAVQSCDPVCRLSFALHLNLQVKVQYSDPAGSFLHTSAAKQVNVVLRHGHRPGTADIEISLPKLVCVLHCPSNPTVLSCIAAHAFCLLLYCIQMEASVTAVATHCTASHGATCK